MPGSYYETLAEDLSREIAGIESKLEELQVSYKQVGRDEDEALDNLWRERKSAERIYECWSGSQAERFVGYLTDECNRHAKKVRYMADAMRDEYKVEMNKLKHKRYEAQEELKRIRRKEAD